MRIGSSTCRFLGDEPERASRSVRAAKKKLQIQRVFGASTRKRTFLIRRKWPEKKKRVLACYRTYSEDFRYKSSGDESRFQFHQRKRSQGQDIYRSEVDARRTGCRKEEGEGGKVWCGRIEDYEGFPRQSQGQVLDSTVP